MQTATRPRIESRTLEMPIILRYPFCYGPMTSNEIRVFLLTKLSLRPISNGYTGLSDAVWREA
jgi:hypothetical protein